MARFCQLITTTNVQSLTGRVASHRWSDDEAQRQWYKDEDDGQQDDQGRLPAPKACPVGFNTAVINYTVPSIMLVHLHCTKNAQPLTHQHHEHHAAFREAAREQGPWEGRLPRLLAAHGRRTFTSGCSGWFWETGEGYPVKT